MFDRYILHPGSAHVSVSHTEKRAPTDESVRLLREMEGAAKDQVVQSMRLVSAGVEAVVHRYDDPLDCKTRYAIHYKVNGHQRKVTVSVDDYKAEIPERLEAVWKAVAEDMAALLISSVAKQVVGR